MARQYPALPVSSVNLFGFVYVLAKPPETPPTPRVSDSGGCQRERPLCGASPDSVASTKQSPGFSARANLPGYTARSPPRRRYSVTAIASISTSISARGKPVKTVVRQGSTVPLVFVRTNSPYASFMAAKSSRLVR